MFLLVLFLLLTARPIACYEPGDLEGQTLVFTGKVDTVRCPGEKQQIFISKVALSGNNFSKTDNGISDNPAGLICYVDGSAPRPLIGEKILVKGTLTAFSRATNPGQFDQGRYYQIRGYDALLYHAKILGGNQKYGLKELLFRFRDRWERVYHAYLDAQSAGVVSAMVLGDKDDLDSELKELFRRSGQAHLLAISALHMSVVSGIVYEVLRRILKNRLVCGTATMVLVVLYGEMTQMSSSTKRAVIMFLLYMTSQLCNRCYDLMTSMAVAAVLSLVLDPLMIYDAGFLLSYFAVLGVGLIMPLLHPLKQYLADRGGIYQTIGRWKIIDTVSASFAVSCFTFPLTLYFFYQYPVFSPILTLIMIPLMGVLLTFAIALGFLGLVLGSPPIPHEIAWWICRALALPCLWILRLFEKLCKLPEQVGILSLNEKMSPYLFSGQPKLWEIGFYYMALFFLLWTVNGKNLKRRWIVGSGIAFLTALLLVFWNLPSGMAITVMDVGQGDCILVQSEGVNILVDGGSSDEKNVGTYRILPCLKALGVSHLDMILISHTDADHVNGITELMARVGGDGVAIYQIGMTENSLESEAGRQIAELADEKKITVRKLARGDILSNGRMKIKVLYPKRGETGEPNELSMVCRLDYKDFSMLLTGDIEGSGEDELVKYLDEERTCTVYKAAHHGSRGTGNTSLLERVMPRVSVVSCGTGYGHPHAEAIARMKAIGSRIYVTKESGAIRIQTDGSLVNIHAYRE